MEKYTLLEKALQLDLDHGQTLETNFNLYHRALRNQGKELKSFSEKLSKKAQLYRAPAFQSYLNDLS